MVKWIRLYFNVQWFGPWKLCGNVPLTVQLIMIWSRFYGEKDVGNKSGKNCPQADKQVPDKMLLSISIRPIPIQTVLWYNLADSSNQYNQLDSLTLLCNDRCEASSNIESTWICIVIFLLWISFLVYFSGGTGCSYIEGICFLWRSSN